MTFKTVFKIAAVLVAMTAATARAETVYHTPRSLLSEFFPKSDNVRFQRYTISPALRERLARRLGYTPRHESYVFYIASTAGRVDGYAIIDDELGQTEPITFGVKLSPDGVVERAAVLIYREPRGDEVRSKHFLDQLRGKNLNKPCRAGVDIDAVSGATISSHSIANGVRRALVLFDELVAQTQKNARADAR
jgi:H+/Na+-translocating ferredoxin:NAD+ oxidoreductase subunit G